MIFQVLSTPNQPHWFHAMSSGGRRAGHRSRVLSTFYFHLCLSVFVLELPQSSPSHLMAGFVLSCAQQLLLLCPVPARLISHFCSADSEGAVPCSAEPEPGAQPMQSTGTGLTSAPFSFSVQCFHRSSQPEVKLPRNSPVYFYCYF